MGMAYSVVPDPSHETGVVSLQGFTVPLFFPTVPELCFVQLLLLLASVVHSETSPPAHSSQS